jgi:hypothetical protein
VAKKKSRVPTPPRSAQTPGARPVQAPRTRKTESPAARTAGSARRTRLVFMGLGAVLVVVALAIGLATAFGGGSDASAALSAAGCTNVTLPSQGRQHVTELKKGFHYNSFPPTSGPHYPQWALWNFYDKPVPLIRSTHNLEHGGIVVQYGDQVPQSTVEQIRQWYLKDPTALLVAPLPALKDKVALTAWQHLATCPGFNEKAFDAFRDAHIFKGPERYPADRLQPNM